MHRAFAQEYSYIVVAEVIPIQRICPKCGRDGSPRFINAQTGWCHECSPRKSPSSFTENYKCICCGAQLYNRGRFCYGTECRRRKHRYVTSAVHIGPEWAMRFALASPAFIKPHTLDWENLEAVKDQILQWELDGNVLPTTYLSGEPVEAGD